LSKNPLIISIILGKVTTVKSSISYMLVLHRATWRWARKAFDKLESKQQGRGSVEIAGTQNAQRLGWETGVRDSGKGIGAYTYRVIRAIPGAYNYFKK
jgi:hypothetical protein